MSHSWVAGVERLPGQSCFDTWAEEDAADGFGFGGSSNPLPKTQHPPPIFLKNDKKRKKRKKGPSGEERTKKSMKKYKNRSIKMQKK